MATSSAVEDANSSLPPLSALVVTCFDQRRGNSILWQRTVEGLELGQGLEYKALPSGLHTVESDLIYFVHKSEAGLSAFENVVDVSAKRGASFYSVAALTPRDGSRLGKVWLHASRLQALATSLRNLAWTSDESSGLGKTSTLSPDSQAAQKLEEYWNDFKQSNESSTESPQGEGVGSSSKPRQRRRRGLSESMPITQAPDTHPASSASLLLDSLGPLLFPLCRHALLRKRILVVRKPPLRHTCEFVYLISILSALSPALAEELPIAIPSLDPVFTIGIYDITDLEARSKAQDQTAWIACTSDELLATKSQLYDIKVEFPASTTESSSSCWPTITTSAGVPLKATQRDLRHYKALRTRLHALYDPASADESYRDDPDSEQEDARLLPHQQTDSEATDNYAWIIEDEAAVTESLPFAAIAYDSFMWWASAGERDTDYQEERDFDTDLLDAAFGGLPESPSRRRHSMSMSSHPAPEESLEMGLAAYFQRLTTLMLQRMEEVVPRTGRSEGSEGEEQDGEEGKGFMMKEDLIKMGLDVWSKSDRGFVEELARRYFDAEVEVQGKSVECCGVRLL